MNLLNTVRVVLAILLLPGVIVTLTIFIAAVLSKVQDILSKVWPNLLFYWLFWPWELLLSLPYIGPKIKDKVYGAIGLNNHDEVMAE